MRTHEFDRRRRPFCGLLPLITLAISAAVLAQPPSPQERAAALKQSLAQNQAALRQYTWIETTQISLNGEVKKQEQKQCSYGADGKVQKTPVAAAPAAQQPPTSGGGRRGGRVKQKVVENKTEDIKDYMERVAALVHEYVPPDAQKIQQAETAGNVSMQPGSSGALTLTAKNYAKPGDALSIGFDAAGKKLSSYRVASYMEKPKDDDVTLSATFASLADGTSYPQQIVLAVKAKKIEVKITNSGHRKTGS